MIKSSIGFKYYQVCIIICDIMAQKANAKNNIY